METYLCMHAQISSDICPRACSYVHRNERVTHAPRYTCTHIDRHRHRHRHKHVSICRHVENTCYVAHDSPEIDPVLLSFACGKTGCCANRRGQAMETKISRRVMIKEVGEIKVSSHLISSYLILSHLISTQLISSHLISLHMYIYIPLCVRILTGEQGVPRNDWTGNHDDCEREEEAEVSDEEVRNSLINTHIGYTTLHWLFLHIVYLSTFCRRGN